MLLAPGTAPSAKPSERRDDMKRLEHRLPIWTLSYFALYLPWFMALEARDPAQCTIVQLSIDHRIPFCEYFIIPYLLWFFYIGAGITYMMLTQPKKEYYRFAGLLFGGFTVCVSFKNV